MELVADILLVAGALGAGLYCFVLARRLNRFNDLEKGVGGAVAVLSVQVDDLSKTLIAAQDSADGSNAALSDLTGRAEVVAQRLELLMASMHDMPDSEDLPRKERQPPVEKSTRRPTGPMFVRHERSHDEAAQ